MDIIWIEARKQDAYCCITTKGEVDAHSSSKLQSALVEAIDASLNLVVDINQVTYIDSNGIGVLMDAKKRCSDVGRQMIIVCSGSNHIAQKIFRMLGLESFFTIATTVDIAIQQVEKFATEDTQN